MEVEATLFIMGYSLSVLRYQYKRTRWIVILLSHSKSPHRDCPATACGRPLALNGSETAVCNVIPAKAGIQCSRAFLDSRLRGSDDRDALACPRLTKNASDRTVSRSRFTKVGKTVRKELSYVREVQFQHGYGYGV